MGRVWSKKATYGGITFDSKLERDYYIDLLAQKATGIVKDITIQPTFEVVSAFTRHGKRFRPITYTPDFLVEYADGTAYAIDVKTKGTKTQQGELRAKLFCRSCDIPLIWVTRKNKEWEPMKKWYKRLIGKDEQE